MVGVGEPVYNTEQRREMLRQLKEHLDNEWLKRKTEGRLSKKKIILPGAEPIKKLKKKRKTKTKRKRKARLFKVIQGTKYGDDIVLKEIKRIKRKNRKYKNKKWQVFRTKQ